MITSITNARIFDGERMESRARLLRTLRLAAAELPPACDTQREEQHGT